MLKSGVFGILVSYGHQGAHCQHGTMKQENANWEGPGALMSLNFFCHSEAPLNQRTEGNLPQAFLYSQDTNL